MRKIACPICKKAVEQTRSHRSFPFCSERCKLIDLANWLEGRYRVASEAPFSEGEEGIPDAEPEGGDY